jgi:hypothetical protein
LALSKGELTEKNTSGTKKRLEWVKGEVARLNNKAKSAKMEKYPASNRITTPDADFLPYLNTNDQDIPDEPYSSFEWLLTEHGAPANINYFWSMYTSRAGYCDILLSDVEKMDLELVKTDLILSAIKSYQPGEYDGVQG